MVGRPRRRSALEVGIGTDELDRAAELVGARPQIERQRFGIDAGLVLWRADQRITVAVSPQHRARHQVVRARHPALGRARGEIFARQLLHRRKAPAAAERPLGQPVLEHAHQLVLGMARRRHVGRIEQHQRVPAPADLDRVLHGGAARHGMENADRGLAAEAGIDRLQHALEIAAQLRIGMVRGLGRDVLAVIAEVEHQHVVCRREVLPERQIGVRREAVAVRHHQPHAIGIAVPPHPDVRAVL